MNADSTPTKRPSAIRHHHEATDQMLLRFAREVRDLAHEMQLDPSRPAGERTVAALFLEFLNARERKAR